MKINEYEQQAIDFLIKTNTNISKSFIKNGYHFDNDEHKRDIWAITIENKKHSYTFMYGNSLAESVKNNPYQKPKEPSDYNILACLTCDDYWGNVDDFAGELGYKKPSEAIRVYERVLDEIKNIKKLFTDDELELLREII